MKAPQSPPCAREARVAEHVGHERGEGVGDLGRRRSAAGPAEREAVAGQRRRDHRERVGRVAAEARRVGQQREDLVELPDRARPAVREQQRHRVRTAALLVDEVQVDAAERHRELSEGVEPRLVRAPVEAVAPVRDQRPAGTRGWSRTPSRARDLVGPAHAVEALAQVGE